MPKRRQVHTAGLIFHVMNRAVRKAPLFTKPGDYETFFDGMRGVPAWLRMRVLAIARFLVASWFHRRAKRSGLQSSHR